MLVAFEQFGSTCQQIHANRETVVSAGAPPIPSDVAPSQLPSVIAGSLPPFAAGCIAVRRVSASARRNATPLARFNSIYEKISRANNLLDEIDADLTAFEEDGCLSGIEGDEGERITDMRDLLVNHLKVPDHAVAFVHKC